jgi:hypothetical protein
MKETQVYVIIIKKNWWHSPYFSKLDKNVTLFYFIMKPPPKKASALSLHWWDSNLFCKVISTNSFFFCCLWFKIINVYQQEYESAGAFWPHVHTRIISCLIMQQISLLGLLATKKAPQCTPILIFLPIFTIAFNLYCKSRFEPAFRKYPLEVSVFLFLQNQRRTALICCNKHFS